TLFCTCDRSESQLFVEAPYAEAIVNGKNITADPPRTEIWALLYAQVRPADGKDSRNILLDDRRLLVRPRLREGFSNLKITVPAAFENRDAAVKGITHWTQDEILQMLHNLGLPEDSSLSVLCVEMMPKLGR